jgi:hypothetical protein
VTPLESTESSLATAFRRLAVVVVAGFAAATAFASNDPLLPLLVDEGNGRWIVADEEISLGRRFDPETRVQFRRRFDLRETPAHTTVQIRALGRFRAELDGELLAETAFDETRATMESAATVRDLEPGRRELHIEVVNRRGPAIVWVDAELPALCSSAEWEFSVDDGGTWQAVRLAGDAPSPAVARAHPETGESLLRILPWLLPLFVAAVFVSRRFGSAGKPAWGMDARHVRNLMIAAWTLLGWHNILQLPEYVGYDVHGHFEYFEFLVEHRTIPRAGDGWQMFQSPLYYLLNAPLVAALDGRMPAESIIKLLRAIPLACGLIQIQIVYCIGRRVFPENAPLQCVSLLVGGWMPMSLSMSQTIGNEPLAGCLTAWTILLAVRMFGEPSPSRRTFAGIGAAWGLALLTKVTPALLGPALVVGVFVKSRESGRSRLQAGANVLVVCAAAVAVCGWYYLRNLLIEGRPFVGGWDASRGIAWWQHPGYRTPGQMLSFGRSLVQPVYAGVAGLWDGLYSTIWTDGFLSGIASYDVRPPWNESCLVAGALLAIVPTALILAGCVRAATSRTSATAASRPATAFAAVCLLTWLAATAYLYFRVPIYSAAKGSYLLGLLPCFGLLAAAGAEPILRRPWGRALLTGFLVCWAVNTLATFYI